MIKNNNIWKICIASILLLVLWTFVCINTSLFIDGKTFLTFEYILCYVMTVATWFIISFRFKFSKSFGYFISWLIFALTPFVCMQISMIFFPDINYSTGIYMVNVLIYAGILFFIFALTQSTRWASLSTVIVSYAFNIISHLVGLFRGTPFIPGDLFAVGTAIGVAKQYEFEISITIIFATILAIFFIVTAFKFPLKLNFKFKHIIYPASGLLASIIIFTSLGMYDISSLNLDLFDQERTNKTYGMTYNFYINIRRMALQKPNDYNSDELQEILDSTPKSRGEDLPNVLVIMNESLSDLSVVGDFETSTPYMPYINSLKKDTVRGEILVSPFGGYTCNSEFEFLSGATMGLLPQGSAPYLQYVTKPLPYSMPSHLKSLGYKTVAFHPYYARGWNREKVYGLMGFDDFISIENTDKYTDSIKTIRGYTSDKTSYDVVKNLFDIKKENEKLFLFNITMQNHGGYTHGDYRSTVKLKGMSKPYPATEQYLTLVKESDNAFKDLISHFSKYDEKIIILMFGDHMPAIEQEFYEELKGKPLGEWSGEELASRHRIPFIIWTNYDIEEKDNIKTSTNYLQNYLYDVAKIPKNGFNVFLDNQMKNVVQINSMGYYNANGEWFNINKQSQELSTYSAIEYYMLTGK